MEASDEFFIDEPIYWKPGPDAKSIYQQISKKKYRNIHYKQIQSVIDKKINLNVLRRIAKHLGSGQFGTVTQGIWHSPYGSIDVAIKTLNDNTSEEDKVKFLQEAAIMGQFHHPNIVKLYGVVTDREPVSNVCIL